MLIQSNRTPIDIICFDTNVACTNWISDSRFCWASASYKWLRSFSKVNCDVICAKSHTHTDYVASLITSPLSYSSVRSSYTTTPSRSNGIPDKFCDLDRHSAIIAASSLRIRLRRFLLKFI